jgi:16S rRNA (cytosine967-C5)-methyltransferase
VQDISAGETAIILKPKKGEKILDACSAPGGKTTHMAELMENVGEIEAWDVHKHRCKLVEENAKRLGINIIKTKTQDATVYDENFVEKFDKILLDVPCLGIGVIKRKPDIKWQRKKEDIQEISKIQLEILTVCSKYLKQGGKLVYSTCSILEKENHNIIEKFLKNNKNYTIEKEEKIMPTLEQDGFYICKMNKK